ncbi:hypothetical protein Barb4_02075 [Bacteroidales bacterium Barb4]|nr:hypothetical protein Barb4_02075 [Bacteroidales bacterium Barb4]
MALGLIENQDCEKADAGKNIDIARKKHFNCFILLICYFIVQTFQGALTLSRCVNSFKNLVCV